MALIDLNPEQRRLVESALVAPPPPQYQAAQISPEIRAKAAAGMLGSAGKFIEYMAREQEKKREEERIGSLAKEAASINPLDPEYDVKLQKLALRDPAAFATAPVQQALNLGDATRKLAQEQAQAKIAGAIFNLPSDQRQELLQSGNPVAFQNLPLLQKAEEMDVAREEALADIPEFARPEGEISPARAKLAAKQFNESLPPALRKVRGLENRLYVLSLADQWKKEKAAETGSERPKEGYASEKSLAAITAALGDDPDKAYVSEATVDSILKAADKFGGPKAATPTQSREEFIRKTFFGSP